MGLRQKIKRQHADHIGRKFWRDTAFIVPTVFICNQLGWGAGAAVLPAMFLMLYRETRAK